VDRGRGMPGDRIARRDRPGVGPSAHAAESAPHGSRGRVVHRRPTRAGAAGSGTVRHDHAARAGSDGRRRTAAAGGCGGVAAVGGTRRGDAPAGGGGPADGGGLRGGFCAGDLRPARRRPGRPSERRMGAGGASRVVRRGGGRLAAMAEAPSTGARPTRRVSPGGRIGARVVLGYVARCSSDRRPRRGPGRRRARAGRVGCAPRRLRSRPALDQAGAGEGGPEADRRSRAHTRPRRPHRRAGRPCGRRVGGLDRRAGDRAGARRHRRRRCGRAAGPPRRDERRPGGAACVGHATGHRRVERIGAGPDGQGAPSRSERSERRASGRAARHAGAAPG
jgi:hypothetical protein